MSELIVALDFDDMSDAVELAEEVQGVVPWVKVGLELFVSEGPRIIQKFKSMGFKVFVDLKLYDIPNTVKGASVSAIKAGADLLTIHLSGGERMCQAAIQASKNCTTHHPLIFGVSVLTSFGEGEMPGYSGSLEDMVHTLARGASAWRMDGIVCSGHEVEKIKTIAPDLLCLTPGIRLADNATSDDQRRIMTPYEAVKAGSDFLVVGRPITRAEDPRAVSIEIVEQIKKATLI